jgi:DNA-binding beta-propeller fold protein YncE
MTLRLVNFINLPPEVGRAAYGRPELHQRTARLYIPLRDEDALAVVDCIENQYLHTIPHLPGVSAVVTADQADLLLATAPAASEVVAIEPGQDRVVTTLKVHGAPEELAYDPIRGQLLVAFAGRPANPAHFRVAVVDVQRQQVIGDVQVPGPTRQVLFDRQSDMFYVVVTDPAQILALDANSPTRVAHAFDVAARGLRSIAVGPQGTRLFCTCDDASLITIDRRSGQLLSHSVVSGASDTIFYSPTQGRLYMAIEEHGTIEVFDTVLMASLGTIETEPGATHFAFDRVRHKIYALLPESRRVAVYEDSA